MYSVIKKQNVVWHRLSMLLSLAFFSVTYSSAEENVARGSLEQDVKYLDYLLDVKISSGSFLELDIEKSPVSMTVITKEMIKYSGARNMSELLEIFVPGFQYMFNKWNGTLWGMRGVANDRNTKIIYLVNGHKMNTQARDGFQGETVLGLLNDIERVEILRGPAGLVYGSGAIAGIINVITRKAEENQVEIGSSFRTDGSQEIQANIYAIPQTGQKLSLSAGFRRTDGLNAHQSRIYGFASWPYPQNGADKNGVPSDGNHGSTDGNWRVSGDWDVENFNLYFRATRQKENAGGWFIQDPWPEIMSEPDSTFAPRVIDGKSVTFADSFWSQTESFRSNRRQYISDNVMIEGNYRLPVGVNEIRFTLGYDRNTTRIGTEKRPGYESDYYERRVGFVEETFGETRLTAKSMFLFNHVPRLQVAAGLEYRLDLIGDDMYGRNEKKENPLQWAVTEINYNTFSLFTEGMYEVSEKLNFDLGGRLDFHTRAFMANPKVAVTFKPAERHSVKVICQASSNNGSADNYEYNRFHLGENGEVLDEPYFERPYRVPSTKIDLLQPAQPLDSLHNLKPEKVYSAELAYAGRLTDDFVFTPSVSLGYVKDLFGWSQKIFRVVNVGSYKYFNLDLDARYEKKGFTIGANHTFQRPFDTDVKEQAQNFKIYSLDTNSIFYDSMRVDGKWYYMPVVGDTMIDYEINLVKDAVTSDGSDFLNLNTHLTKLYMTYMPFDWMALHADLRIFWGLWGRDAIYSKDKGFQYWNISKRRSDQGFSNYLKESVSKKFNASIHLFLPKEIELSLFAYDIFGLDRPAEKNMGKYTINSLRWQQMADPTQKDIYSTDQRLFGIRMSKNF